MPIIQAAGTEFFYEEDCLAPPWREPETVFIQHGLCRNTNFVRSWVPAFVGDYRVVRMDVRGCGGSADPGPDWVCTLDGWVSDFIAFLDAKGIDKVHYVGESIGGIIGAAAAAEHPERFHSVTLVSTPIKVRPDTDQKLAFGYADQPEAFEKMGLEAWWHRSQEHSRGDSVDPARDEYLGKQFARTPVHVAQAIVRWIVTADLSTVLPRITVPTLLMSPGQSYITSTDSQSDIAAMLPNAQQKAYPDYPHAMYYTRADVLSRDAFEFIKSLGQ